MPDFRDAFTAQEECERLLSQTNVTGSAFFSRLEPIVYLPSNIDSALQSLTLKCWSSINVSGKGSESDLFFMELGKRKCNSPSFNPLSDKLSFLLW